MQWFNQSASHDGAKIEYLVAYPKANGHITEIRYYEKSGFGRFRIEWEDYCVSGTKEQVAEKATELLNCDWSFYPFFVRRLNAVRLGFTPIGYNRNEIKFNGMVLYFKLNLTRR